MHDELLAIDAGLLSAWVEGPESGRPVLFLHGFPQSRHTWRDQLPALAEAGFRAVAPDQRGYSAGARPGSIEDYATALLVGDVLALIEGLGGSVDLVGHDWGGQLAWLTAAHHREAVRSLTVLSRPHPAAFAQSFAVDDDQADRSKHHTAFHDPSTADRLLDENARRLRTMLSRASVPDSAIEEYLSVLGHRDALDAALNWYRATPPAGLRLSDTPVVEVPTLYLWGTDDQSVGRAAAEFTEHHVAAAYHFVELDGGGHFLTDDGCSEQITQCLLDHLAAT